ncbi:MAG: hypothetical protein V7754_10985 [Halioglobus sp.]
MPKTGLMHSVTLQGIALFLAVATPIAQGDSCAVKGENFLLDPSFTERDDHGRLAHWRSLQHAGESSFEVTIENGELTIAKTGTQPWFMFRQSIKTEQLAGKKLAFDAELKFDLQPPAVASMFTLGGGLQLAAKPASSGRPLLRSSLNHEPRLGKVDWHAVQVVVQLPRRTGLIELGFAHQADGVLQIRQPTFRLVDESEQPCEITPLQF